MAAAAAICLSIPAKIVAQNSLDLTAADSQVISSELKMSGRNPQGVELGVNSRYLTLGGTPWLPVMGEFHYSRYPRVEWQDELLKMKAGGVDIVATYVFWIHHEEVEGHWDWTGDRDLRAFVSLCGKLGLRCVIRCGPWDHGEVRNGGFPEWLLDKHLKLRTDDPAYLGEVQHLYEAVAGQLHGQLWKDGGPVVGLQIENEFYGDPQHLLTLKRLAVEAGLDLPLYTRTGWPELKSPLPFGQLLPLFGGYAEGFWDRKLETMPGHYWTEFVFKKTRTDADIASDHFGAREATDAAETDRYPYLTCEIGPGMPSSYHRRISVFPLDVLSMVVTKLGSGSNSPGYYMYHGGTNPTGKEPWLQENQASRYTNVNDLPVKSYDFQTALGEFGQAREQYHLLRLVHLSLHGFGDRLGPMAPVFPADPIKKDDHTTLRWAVRTDGLSGFVFINNYQRLLPLPARPDTQLKLKTKAGELTFPQTPVTVAADHAFFWPFNLDLGDGVTLRYATAQPVCQLRYGGTVYTVFAETGNPTEFAFTGQQSGAALLPHATPGTAPAMTLTAKNGVTHQIILLDEQTAKTCYLGAVGGGECLVLTPAASVIFDGGDLRLTTTSVADVPLSVLPVPKSLTLLGQTLDGTPDGVFTRYAVPVKGDGPVAATVRPIREAGPLRTIRLGGAKVAAEPTDAEFAAAAAWQITLPAGLDPSRRLLLRVHYIGDVARVYLGDRLLTDHFYNGTPFEIGLNRYGPDALMHGITLKVLPLQRNAPIYMLDAVRPDFKGQPAAVSLDGVDVVESHELRLSLKCRKTTPIRTVPDKNPCPALSLAGPWAVRLDPTDIGLREDWSARDEASPQQSVQLPGSIQAQGLGNVPTKRTQWTASLFDAKWYEQPRYAHTFSDDGPLRFPFFLLPTHEYVGPVWYWREFEVPLNWVGKRLALTLERPHWQTQVWIDGTSVGSNDSLGTPHRYELGTSLAAGRHRIALRIDNRLLIDVGRNAHSVTDHTQTNWNGVIGDLEICATDPVWIAGVRAFPDVQHRVVRLSVDIGNVGGKSGRGVLSVKDVSSPVDWTPGGARLELTLKLPADAMLWDESGPHLHRLDLSLRGEGVDDATHIDIGLREFTVVGTQFSVNGRPTFLRGTLECCIFPKTGYPPTDAAAWEQKFRICKDHGLNHVRFHSWCPPRAAFAAADTVGMYLQIECGVWANHDGTTLGSGPLGDWIMREGDRILAEYGNHPSFVMLAHGNEPAGDGMKPYLSGLVEHWKRTDPRRLYTGATGWSCVPEDDYQAVMRAWEKTPARGQDAWAAGDYGKAVAAAGRPLVSHEVGQHCVYPVFEEIEKYTGHLRPTNLELFRDSLRASGMFAQAAEFVAASGALQVLCYKEDIEAALRTRGMAGFQLLDLHDFPGQGTALVGVLDAFWESKGYVSSQEFRRFCGETVPLVRLPSRLWTNSQTLVADAEIAHFGPRPIENARPVWQLRRAEDGKVLARGELAARDIPIGNGISLGQIRIDLALINAPRSLRLVLGLAGSDVENAWNLWLYAASNGEESLPEGMHVSTHFGEEERAYVEAGDRLLLLPPPGSLADQHPHGSFIPVFWNRLLMKDQHTQTLGLLCDPAHAALADFPTGGHADWQWQDLCDRASYVALDTLPRELRPIVQPIDDWNTNRRLGLVFECAVGRGRVLVCSADLSTDLEKRPAARQLRRSLIHYLGGGKLAPAVSVDAASLADLMRPAAAKPPRVSVDPSLIPMTEGQP